MYSDIISLFGGILSEILHKPLPACRGIFRLAIYDLGYREKLEDGKLNYNDLERVVAESLKNRLSRLHILNLDDAIQRMRLRLVEHQGLLTMMYEKY